MVRLSGYLDQPRSRRGDAGAVGAAHSSALDGVAAAPPLNACTTGTSSTVCAGIGNENGLPLDAGGRSLWSGVGQDGSPSMMTARSGARQTVPYRQSIEMMSFLAFMSYDMTTRRLMPL